MSTDQNKTEKPTPFKLKEARKRGQVTKSMEINAMSTLVCFLVLSYVFWQTAMIDYQQMTKHYFALAQDVSNEPLVLSALVGRIVDDGLAIIMPFLAVILLVGVLSNLLQIGVVFSAFPLKPDFTKLNPAKSFERIFSKKTLFELIKNSLKIAIFAVLVRWLATTVLAKAMAVYQVSPNRFPEVWAGLFFYLALWVLAFLIPLALIDFAFNRFDFTKKMMMSTRELKDEYKKREGDPEVKNKQKQIQKELMKKAASLGNVKDADVVITNPTHIAVALQYRVKDMGAPKILAMGKDSFAEKIKAVARLHRIPIVQNKQAARKIYHNSVVDGYIPYDCYTLVAPIFRWVLELKGEQVGGNP